MKQGRRKTTSVVWLIGLSLVVGACSTAGGSDTHATMQAEETAFVEEGTRMVETLQARGTEVMATAAAAETYVANAEGMNRQLAATLRALIPPTQQIVDTSGEVTPGMIPRPGELATQASNVPGAETVITSNQPNTLTGVASASGVNQADGCATTHQENFRTTDRFIYVTAKVLNPVAGTTVGASWAYASFRFFESDTFTIQTNEPELCIWFYIEPSDIPFNPGNWSVQFNFNGVPQEPGAFFSIIES